MLFLDYQPDLNETDIEVYKAIISDVNAVASMSIRELAEKSHTSTASVLRFCKNFAVPVFLNLKFTSVRISNLLKKKKR